MGSEYVSRIILDQVDARSCTAIMRANPRSGSSRAPAWSFGTPGFMASSRAGLARVLCYRERVELVCDLLPWSLCGVVNTRSKCLRCNLDKVDGMAGHRSGPARAARTSASRVSCVAQNAGSNTYVIVGSCTTGLKSVDADESNEPLRQLNPTGETYCSQYVPSEFK